jgi:hypothetical protein
MKYSFLMKTENAAFGIYKSQRQAERALKALEAAGYDPKNVAMVLPYHRGNDFAYLMRNTIGMGAFLGALAGILIGAVLGYFVAGKMYVNDSTLGLLFGAAFGCAFGAAAGALIGIGTPRSIHSRYGEYLRDGGVLVAVHEDGIYHKRPAHDILEETGASDVHETNEADTWKSVRRSLRRAELGKL